MFIKIWSLLNKSQRSGAFFLLFFMLIFALAEVIGIGAVLVFLNLVTNPSLIEKHEYWFWVFSELGFQDKNSFIVFVGFLTIIFIILRNILGFSELWIRQLYIAKLLHFYKTELLDKYLNRSIEFFYQNNSSVLNRNVIQEVPRMISGSIIEFINIFGNLIVTVIILIFMLANELQLTLISTAIIGTGYGIIYFSTRKWIEKLGKSRQTAAELMFISANESFSGYKEAKLFCREDYFIERFRTKSWGHFDALIKARLIDGLPRYLMEIVIFGGVVMLALYLVVYRQDGAAEILGILSLFGLSIIRVLPRIDGMVKGFMKIKFDKAAFDIIHDGLKERKAWGSSVYPLQYVPFKQAIELKNISYQYDGTDNFAVKNCTLRIEKNETVAFVGPTGSGKSTLIDIIIGLLEPKMGELVIDSEIMTDERIRGWRENIGYVPQSIFLLDDTITKNIAFALNENQVNKTLVESAAKIAHIHDFIVTETIDGYDTEVGERGVRFSGGQRQRIGIARALYNRPDVLVLDEATSALDNTTEAIINESIKELSGSKTILLIAHRLSTVRHCDRIYYMENGQVVDCGSYDDLIDSNNSFRAMVNSGHLPEQEMKN